MASDTDDGKFLSQQAVGDEVAEGRKQLPLRQITGRAKDDDDTGASTMCERRSCKELLPTFVTAKVICLTIALGMERVVRVDRHATDGVFHLVVFVKADTFDVVPCGRLMAEEALIHLGLLHASGRH